MKCAGCMKTIKDQNFVKCTSSSCEKSFCSLCINITNLTADRKKLWKCPECCATSKKGGDNSLTPVRANNENVTTRKKSDSAGNELSQLTDQLRTLTQEFSSVKLNLEDLTRSLSYTNGRMDEIMSKIVETEGRIRYLEKRDLEVDILKAKINNLQNELNSQAQYNLSNEMEIVGIPENTNENLHHVVLLAARKVGVSLEENDIDWIARVGPKRPPVTAALPEDRLLAPRPVVVRLLRRTKRDQFLKASKSRKNLSSTDLDVLGSTRRVFFNERLTREGRLLFRDARARAKQQGYAFCWCNHSTIYIRQREGQGAVRISSKSDLDRVLPVQSPSGTSEH
ncbi:uncharacterized protein LOC132902751 [Amyelois transitella]|uniref:uncharacterized protein LOC106129555 n=2 Tax=Amyelois transitella TaxID=680683 RepID=UPI00067DD525|nr:uncharacterized protein LOC106129555 [Amyelois transitella]XP_060804966.1 uncharacterized protein LOC132902751 [Amyelois transitella]